MQAVKGQIRLQGLSTGGANLENRGAESDRQKLLDVCGKGRPP